MRQVLLCILVVLFALLTPEADAVGFGAEAEGWSYAIAADKWPGLCALATSKAQSPVDLDNVKTLTDYTLPTKFPGSAVKKPYPANAVGILSNNGYALELEIEGSATGAGGSFMWKGEEFYFNNFHCHAQAEHTVNLVRADLEAHLVSYHSFLPLILYHLCCILFCI